MELHSQLVQLTSAGAEPLAAEAVKSWLHVDTSDDDDLITLLCQAARVHAEMFCRQSFQAGDTWRLTLNRFPIPFLNGVGFLLAEFPGLWEGEFNYRSRRPSAFSIEIPQGPVSALTSITYLDTSGTSQLLDPATYELVRDDFGPNRIYPKWPNYWPFTYYGPASVTVLFTSGGVVPAPIMLAMYQMVGHWYANREAVTLTGKPESIPLLAENLMRPYRLLEF